MVKVKAPSKLRYTCPLALAMDGHDGTRAGLHHPRVAVAHSNDGDARIHGGHAAPSGTPSPISPSRHEWQLPPAETASLRWFHPPPSQLLWPLPTWDLCVPPVRSMDSVMYANRRTFPCAMGSGPLPALDVDGGSVPGNATAAPPPLWVRTGETLAAEAVADAGRNAKSVAGAPPADVVAAEDQATAAASKMMAVAQAAAFQGGPASADAARVRKVRAPSPATVVAARQDAE